MLVCVAMFAFGGAVLWGLFMAPRGRSPKAPQVPWGAPPRDVVFASIDFGGESGVSDALVFQVRGLEADYVLVQNIRFDDVLPFAEALGMEASYHPQLFQRRDPHLKDATGDLILSRHPLYDARPLVVGASADDTHARGVQAVAVLDGVRFVLVSGVGATDATLQTFEAEWKKSGAPPTVLATGFIRPKRGEGVYRGALAPTVSVTQETEQGGPLVPVATAYADQSWVMTAGNALPGSPGTPMVLHVRLKAWTPTAAAATKPWR
jgi:hypothetical protein